jgi:hypothetical protein
MLESARSNPKETWILQSVAMHVHLAEILTKRVDTFKHGRLIFCAEGKTQSDNDGAKQFKGVTI